MWLMWIDSDLSSQRVMRVTVNGKSYDGARSACIANGGDLMTPNTAARISAIARAVNSSNRCVQRITMRQLFIWRLLLRTTKFCMAWHCRILDLLSMCSWSSQSAGSTVRIGKHQSRPSAVGGWTFQVSGSQIWNKLPEDVKTAPSLPIFRRRLKTYLFQKSYPDILIWVWRLWWDLQWSL